MGNDLLIKINADAENAKKAFDDLRAKTEGLENILQTSAIAAGAAFAALTAEVFFSVHAFEDAQKSSVQLSNALQNQGIYTDELKAKYEGFADAVQAKTGIDNDAIVKAQGVAQAFLGQTEVTQELTMAIADLGAKMGGDLDGAAEKIGRTIGTNTNAFTRQGLVLDETATKAERMAKVLEFVQSQAGGLAEAFNKADGYTHALSTSFGNFQEAIGQRFAPIFAAARKVAIEFFDAFTAHPVLADLATAAIAAGLAISGIVLAVSLAVPAFLALSAAAAAFGLTLGPILLIVGAVAALVAGVVLLALNWDKSMAAVKAATSGMVTLVTELFSGLGAVISGAFHMDTAKMREGLNQITGAFKKSKDETVKTYEEITASQKIEGEAQNAEAKAAADKREAHERQHQANLRAIRQAEIDLLRLTNEHASADLIALKTKEIETLKALDSEKSGAELALYRARLGEITALQEQQNAEDLERQRTFGDLQAATKAELDQQGIATNAQLRDARLAEIRATAMTEADIDRKLQDDILTKRVEAHNKELLDRKKYGEAAAKINAFLNTDEVQGVKSATSELVALQQSKNSTLKSIGKAAAVADITIKTAQSAMNIFEGFSTIPIVGYALGVAGAAAAIVYGGEKIAQVTSAADGGLITGGVAGRDSVPALLMPGELVVPKRNFNDVVGAVQNQSAPDNGEMLQVLRNIDSKFSNPQTNIIQGDVMADDSFVDALVRKISDAIEFRNAKIVGVNL